MGKKVIILSMNDSRVEVGELGDTSDGDYVSVNGHLIHKAYLVPYSEENEARCKQLVQLNDAIKSFQSGFEYSCRLQFLEGYEDSKRKFPELEAMAVLILEIERK